MVAYLYGPILHKWSYCSELEVEVLSSAYLQIMKIAVSYSQIGV